MPIFVCCCHLLNDSFNIFVGCLNCPIHLGAIWSRIYAIDLELLTKFIHHFVIKVLGLCKNTLRKNITTDQLFLDKLEHHFSCNVIVRCRLYPFSEVINDHKNKMVIICGFRINGFNNINSSQIKWPGC